MPTAVLMMIGQTEVMKMTKIAEGPAGKMLAQRIEEQGGYKVLGYFSTGDSGTGISSLMGVPLREARESFEREYLTIQIRRFSGNISKTASFIGMERSALHRKLKALGLGDKGQNGEEER